MAAAPRCPPAPAPGGSGGLKLTHWLGVEGGFAERQSFFGTKGSCRLQGPVLKGCGHSAKIGMNR